MMVVCGSPDRLTICGLQFRGFTSFSMMTYAIIFFWLGVIAAIGVALVCISKESALQLAWGLPLYFLGTVIMQTIGITASPTMYASGARVMYHPSIMQL